MNLKRLSAYHRVFLLSSPCLHLDTRDAGPLLPLLYIKRLTLAAFALYRTIRSRRQNLDSYTNCNIPVMFAVLRKLLFLSLSLFLHGRKLFGSFST